VSKDGAPTIKGGDASLSILKYYKNLNNIATNPIDSKPNPGEDEEDGRY